MIENYPPRHVCPLLTMARATKDAAPMGGSPGPVLNLAYCLQRDCAFWLDMKPVTAQCAIRATAVSMILQLSPKGTSI